MFPLAFVAGWLQGHWWGFISWNYVVWPTFLLMNVFIALKGSHFWFLLYLVCIDFLIKNATLPYPLGFCVGGRGSSSSTAFPIEQSVVKYRLSEGVWKLKSNVSCKNIMSQVLSNSWTYNEFVSTFLTLRVPILISVDPAISFLRLGLIPKKYSFVYEHLHFSLVPSCQLL